MNSKKILYAALKIMSPLLLLVSCTSTNQVRTQESRPPTVTPEPYPLWLTNWLKKPTCAPPCWENIVPGVTGREETKKLLSKVLGISSIGEYEVVPYGQTLEWRHGSITFDANERVQQIEFETLFLKVYLKDLLDRYGSPRYVVVHGRETSGVDVDLAFPDNGLVISLYLHSLGGTSDVPKFSVAPQEEVTYISFYVQGLEYYYSTAWQPLQKYDWKGYTIYPE